MDNKKFGTYLAHLRRRKNWTQRELAERIHVTDKAISKWERGLGFPDIHTLEPLADALDVSVLVSALSLVLLVFLLDAMGWYGFVGVCLPVILLSLGILLLVASCREYRRKRRWIVLTVVGLAAIAIPVAALALFAVAFLWGGPMPN